MLTHKYRKMGNTDDKIEEEMKEVRRIVGKYYANN